MAEIKSTMEMVLERAERMAATASSDSGNDLQIEEGMRIGARYMKGEELDLTREIASKPPEQQTDLRKGIAKTLLRNIILPRDKDLKQMSERALGAIAALDPGREIQGVCHELTQILGQYDQHKTQVTGQVDEAILNQLRQQAMASGQPLPDNLTPAMHPQYHEELNRTLSGLNDQYTQAMDQRKAIIGQRFGL